MTTYTTGSQLDQAIRMRLRAWNAFMMAVTGMTEWGTFNDLNVLAEKAYEKLGPIEAKEFMERMKELTKPV